MVRAGKPNAAASSFASGVIREPLNGQVSECPVAPDTGVWLLSPARVVEAFIHALEHSAMGRVEANGNGLRLGALVRMADAAEHPAVANYPVIAQSLKLAASQQLRNMASLGGNVLQRTRCPYFRDVSYAACNKRNPDSGCAAIDGVNRMHAVLGTSDHCIATYPGDFAQALIALDATVEVIGRAGSRRLPFAALHPKLSLHQLDEPLDD